MDKSEFLKYEYFTLREEIKETKSRIFRLAGLGIIGTPSAYFLVQFFKLAVIAYSLPVLVGIVLLLFLAESRALMRCGRYIRTRIEPHIKDTGGQDFGGWEHWLEERVRGEPGRRIVDQFVTAFFYILFLFYYVASVSLAPSLAQSKYGSIGTGVVLGVYIGLGIVFILALIIAFKHSTSTSD